MRKIILSLFTLFLSIVVSAQENPEQGYIITNQNDTIYGMIDFRTNDVNSKQCLFKENGSEEYRAYNPFDIVGYYFTGKNKFYVSKKFEYKNKSYSIFAEYLVKGMMNVYRVVDIAKEDVYFFENEKGEIMPYRDLKYIYSYDDADVRTNAQNLAAFLAKSSLKASDEVDLRNTSPAKVLNIARTYHNDVCKSNEDCIEFELDVENDEEPESFGAFFLYIGMVHFYNMSDLAIKDNNAVVMGAGYEFNTNRFVKNTGFQLMAEFGNYSYWNGSGWPTKGYMGSSIVTLKMAPVYHYKKSNGVHFSFRAGVTTPMFCGFGGVGVEIPTSSGTFMFNVDATSDRIEFSHAVDGSWAHVGFKAGFKF